MAISPKTPQIGLRLVGCADGSTAVVTERGEMLAMQTGAILNAKPGDRATVTVEFLVDHDKFKIGPSSSESILEIDASRLKLSDLEEEFTKEIRKIIGRVSDAAS